MTFKTACPVVSYSTRLSPARDDSRLLPIKLRAPGSLTQRQSRVTEKSNTGRVSACGARRRTDQFARASDKRHTHANESGEHLGFGLNSTEGSGFTVERVHRQMQSVTQFGSRARRVCPSQLATCTSHHSLTRGGAHESRRAIS